MKRNKKINRGLIAIIILAVLAIGGVLVESFAVKGEVNKVIDKIDEFMTFEAEAYILPEDMREKDAIDIEAYAKEKAESFRDLFYDDIPAGEDKLVADVEGYIIECLANQFQYGVFNDASTVEIRREYTEVAFNDDMTNAVANVYFRVTFKNGENPFWTIHNYTLAKKDGEWYMVATTYLLQEVNYRSYAKPNTKTEQTSNEDM